MWIKSTYCQTSECVEVTNGLLVRDSKDPDGPRLVFTPDAWREFVKRARKDSNLQHTGP